MSSESDTPNIKLAIDTIFIRGGCFLVFYLPDVNTACFARGEVAHR